MIRRRTISAVATVCALGAAILPLVAVSAISRNRSIDAEQAHLREYAVWTLQRADLTLSQAKSALIELEGQPWEGCSSAHVTRMRQLTIDNRYVEEIGYFRDGKLACTSWGAADKLVRQEAPHELLAGGFGLSLGIKPAITGAGSVMVLSLGRHNALIKPERMVDVLRDEPLTLGVATRQGRPVAVSGNASPDFVRLLAHHAANGMNDRYMFAAIKGPDLRAFAISDRSVIDARLDRELWLLIPIGLIVSLVLIGVIVWASLQRLSPEKDLEFAIRRRKFVAHYQPVIEVATGRCVGAEALIRWRRPPRVLNLPPDELIPLAERTGLIADLTDLLIDRVVDDLKTIVAAGLSVHIAINICAADLESGRFLAVLADRLSGSGLAPSSIWLEATERGFINGEAARATIEKARSAGHPVAIDDFGTGYSSLSLLEELPLDALKIDKSFIETIGKSAATSIVTPHIIEMAHGLNLSIVAEGIETLEQEDYIRAAGVQFAQGWLYSKALPVDEFIAYCRRQNGPVPDAAEAGRRLQDA